MGIRGLSSYIESEPDWFFKTVKLHDTILVIDGSCISCYIYRQHCAQTCKLNGDYLDYEFWIKNFFSILKRCNIQPLVILDGGCERRKLDTILERMNEVAASIKLINSTTDYETFMPIFVFEVFKDVLTELKIPFYQSLLEADLDIVKVAQFLNAPVLSYDSDFYLDEVDYIPFALITSDFLNLKGRNDKSEPKYYIQGKLFQRTNFLNKFGSLPNLSFLPLLSFLLGNDYSKTEYFDGLYSHLFGEEKKSAELRLYFKLVALVKWFRSMDSTDTAIKRIIEFVPSKLKKRVKAELKQCLEEKNNDEPNYLVTHLKCLFSPDEIDLSSLQIRENSKIERDPKWLTEAIDYITSRRKENCDKKANSKPVPQETIPNWILANQVLGKLPRNLMNLLNIDFFVLSTQMEVYSLPSISNFNLQILQKIAGIVYNHYSYKESCSFTVFLRIGDSVKRKNLAPIYSESSISLNVIPNLTNTDREKILFSVLNIDKVYLTLIPDNWKLFLITLATWCRTEESTLMPTALGSIIFSSIFLSIIVKKVGYFKNENSFLIKYGEELKILSEKSQDKNKTAVPKMVNENFKENVQEAVLSVEESDCILARRDFGPLRVSNDSNMLVPDTLFKPILHLFAMFQNSVLMTQLLNSILDFPVPPLRIAEIFYGTLAYNISFKIKTFKNLQSFIDSLFGHLPSLRALFYSMIKFVEKLSGCEVLYQDFKIKKASSSSRRSKSKKLNC